MRWSSFRLIACLSTWVLLPAHSSPEYPPAQGPEQHVAHNWFFVNADGQLSLDPGSHRPDRAIPVQEVRDGDIIVRAKYRGGERFHRPIENGHEWVSTFDFDDVQIVKGSLKASEISVVPRRFPTSGWDAATRLIYGQVYTLRLDLFERSKQRLRENKGTCLSVNDAEISLLPQDKSP